MSHSPNRIGAAFGTLTVLFLAQSSGLIAQERHAAVGPDCSTCYNYEHKIPGADGHSFNQSIMGWGGYNYEGPDPYARIEWGHSPETEADAGHVDVLGGTCAEMHETCIPTEEVEKLQSHLTSSDASELSNFLGATSLLTKQEGRI